MKLTVTDQRFEDAAKRVASKMWEEFGRLAMDESDLILNRWPENVDLVLRHAKALRPVHGPTTDGLLNLRREDRSNDYDSCQVDAFMADLPFEIDAVTSPNSSTLSLSDRLRSSSRCPDVFPTTFINGPR